MEDEKAWQDCTKVMREMFTTLSAEEMQVKADFMFSLARWLEIMAHEKRLVENKSQAV